MDEDKFEEALRIVEIGTRGKLDVQFKDQLYEYFKDTEPEVWSDACGKVAQTPAPTSAVRQEDFLREVIRARARRLNTLGAAIAKAMERRRMLEEARRKVAEGPTSEEIMERMAKDNPFAAGELKRLRARRRRDQS